MAEPWLPVEDRMALWDPTAEQVRVIGWRPGPAGVSAVELAPGLRVALDHAAPSTLTEVTVDADDGLVPQGSLQMLARLLGDEAADVVRTLPGLGTPNRPTSLPRHLRRRGSQPQAEMHHVPLLQFVLGVDVADDATRSDLAQAAALLGSLAPGALLGVLALPDLARRGVDLLTRAEHVVPVSPEQAKRLEELIRSARRHAPDTVTDLDVQRAVARIPQARPAARPAARRREAGPRFAAAAPALMAGELADFDAAVVDAHLAAPDAPRGIPLHLDGDHRGWAWLDRGSNVQLTAGASTTGAWGRVLRRSDGLLLGLAPLRPGRREGVGQLGGLVVIPPSPDPDDLVVDIVLDPAMPRRAPAHELTRSAVVAGRRAARLTRLQSPAADAAWQDCARRWQTLGDVQRANLAARHGSRDDYGPARARARSGDLGTGPLLADEL